MYIMVVGGGGVDFKGWFSVQCQCGQSQSNNRHKGKKPDNMTASAMARNTLIDVTRLVFHAEMSRLNLIAPRNISCSNTRCERGRTAECGRASSMPHSAGSLLTSKPSTAASLGGRQTQGGGNQICWGYEVCLGNRYMSASAMARTYIYLTELVSHFEMSALNFVA